ncbi:MAG: hypothetical protein V3G42_07155 [Oscillospiraceae bacterium]
MYEVCIGYYIIERVPKPDWCSLRQKKLLSIGEGVGKKHPDLTGCFWTNYPQEYKQAYAKRLNMTPDEFHGLFEKVCELFETRMAVDCRFQRFEDAWEMFGLLKSIEDLHLVAVTTTDNYLAELQKMGLFEKVGIPRFQEGCEFIGHEILGFERGWFDTYLENSLETVLSRHAKLEFDGETGLLLNPFPEMMTFSNAIQGMGEPVPWMPFRIYEYKQNPFEMPETYIIT